MISGFTVEQVFLRSRQGRYEALLVLLSPSGAPHREKIPLAPVGKTKALEQLARHLAFRSDVEDVAGARLRVESADGLQDDAALRRLFVSTFRRASEGDGTWA